MNVQTLKGFRDFLPNEAKKRQFVLDILKEVFESYGFEPLETPALEYEEILTGKYGDEGEKLMYKFTDLGRRKVALRYDQTVPLARVVAQYQNELPMPFKRYQIQPVWRAENPQRGRYREFLQVDVDIVGSSSPLADAEVIEVAVKSLEKLGFKKFKILLSSRNVLFNKIKEARIPDNLALSVVRVIDKIKKIGWKDVNQELMKLGLSSKTAQNLNDLLSTIQPIEDSYMNEVWSEGNKLGLPIQWYPYLARGLDYYTGIIFEIEVEGYSAGSVGGGGRYDNLIGMFANKQVPAVGFSFGFDRLIEAMDELDLFPKDVDNKSVLVTIFSPDLKDKSIDIISLLRKNNIAAELFLDENTSLEKQLKYADKKGVRYAVIAGPNEVKKGTVMLKDLKNKSQKEIPQNKLPDEIK